MPLDDCKHTFDGLAREVLPGLLKQLRPLMKQSAPMSEFSQQGVGVAEHFPKSDTSGGSSIYSQVFLPAPHDGYTHFLFPTRPFERGASNQSRQTCYGSEADVFAIR